MLNRRDLLLRSLAWSGALGAAPYLLAADAPRRKLRFGEFNPEHEKLDIFAGIDDGSLQVRLICKDSTEASLTIVNKTDKPVNVKLPETFAGVPVFPEKKAIDKAERNGRKVGLLDGTRTRPAGVELPEAWGGLEGLAQQGLGGGQNQQNQQAGGGFGGGGGGQAGGGFFNVPPEKLVQLKAPLVCLEHGKRDPNSGITYYIKKVEEVTTKPGVRELLLLLADGKLSQVVAQAAAWHLNNDLSWEKIASLYHERAGGGQRVPQFTAQEVAFARQAATACLRQAQEVSGAQKSIGELLQESETK